MATLTIRGDMMAAGYIDSLGPTRLSVFIDGDGMLWDARARAGDKPMTLDADGMLTQAAVPGYGFLPEEGEVDRLREAGWRG